MTPKSTAVLALTLGVAPLVFAARARSAEPLADAVGDCAVVTAGVRYSAGYTHVVTLANHCERAVSCEVWTNVDPAPHLTLRAKPGEGASVVTRIGSPSRDVTAGKSCHYE
ncbi:MAG TPA: hypothetical protein VGM44_08725 [Polyangiaceae bacterium]